MAIVVKPNQAMAVSADPNCGCGGRYCQPVSNDDVYMLQGYSTPDTGTTILYDGLFTDVTGWTLDSGWSISGGKMYGNVANSGAVSRAIGMLANEWYLVYANIGTAHAELLDDKNITAAAFSKTFTITQVGDFRSYFANGTKFKIPGTTLNTGVFTVVSTTYLVNTFITVSETVVNESIYSCVLTDYTAETDNNIYYDIKINGSSFLPLDTGSSSKGNNKYYWFYKPSSITTGTIEITQASGVQGTIQVNEVQVYKVSTPGLSKYNSFGTITSHDDTPDIEYFPEDVYYSAQSENLEQPDLNWQLTLQFDEDAGTCLTPCLYDSQWINTDAVNNGNFTTDLSFWAAGTGWTWNSGAQVNHAHPGSLTQTVILEGGAVYTHTFSVFPNGLLFYYTINGDVAMPEASYSGVVSQTIDLTSYTGNVTIVLVFTGVNSVSTILLYSRIFGTYDRRNCLGCVRVIATGEDCNLLFTATNNDNAFGFDYSNDLVHTLRVNAKKIINGYPEEKEDFLFSDNSRRLLFARSETEYEISLTDAPDHIHSCLRMMRLNDTFTIDEVEYIAEGNYELRKRRTSDLKQAVFTVKEKQGIGSNYSCS